jgi:hypothetical protein
VEKIFDQKSLKYFVRTLLGNSVNMVFFQTHFKVFTVWYCPSYLPLLPLVSLTPMANLPLVLLIHTSGSMSQETLKQRCWTRRQNNSTCTSTSLSSSWKPSTRTRTSFNPPRTPSSRTSTRSSSPRNPSPRMSARLLFEAQNSSFVICQRTFYSSFPF